MSTDAILASLNEVLQTDIIAALAGLSLTAAAFMATLKTESLQKLNVLESESDDYASKLNEAKRNKNKADIKHWTRRLADSEKRIETQKKLGPTASLATRQLIHAFFFLTASLIDMLSVSPFLKHIFAGWKGSALMDLAPDLATPLNDLVSEGTLGLGIYLLMRAAKQILVLVPPEGTSKKASEESTS